VRCHLGVGPQERTAEEHTTRGPRTTLATFGRGTSGGMVYRGWSLSTVPCEGGMCPALTSTTSGSQRRSLMSCLPELTDDDRMDHMLDCSARWGSLCLMARCARCDVRRGAAYFVVARRPKACPSLLHPLLAPLAEAGARSSLPSSFASQTKGVSAHSLVQDSDAPAWLSRRRTIRCNC
jgi:hypothetical protein